MYEHDILACSTDNQHGIWDRQLLSTTMSYNYLAVFHYFYIIRVPTVLA